MNEADPCTLSAIFVTVNTLHPMHKHQEIRASAKSLLSGGEICRFTQLILALFGKQENQNIIPTQIGAYANIRCKHGRAARKINKGNQMLYKDKGCYRKNYARSGIHL